MMKTSIGGIELIKDSEGCKLDAYLDTSGVPTIGYGNIFINIDGNERRIKLGDSITQPYAETLFDTGLHEREEQLNKALGDVKLTQGQFDAVIDWLWQFGIGNLESSTLFKEILANPNDTDIPNQFRRWVHGHNGEVLEGLVVRRDKEIILYNS